MQDAPDIDVIISLDVEDQIRERACPARPGFAGRQAWYSLGDVADLLAHDNFVQTGIGSAKVSGEFLLGDTHRLQKFLEQHFTGLRGWSVLRKHADHL